jgi:hypothetical protein
MRKNSVIFGLNTVISGKTSLKRVTAVQATPFHRIFLSCFSHTYIRFLKSPFQTVTSIELRRARRFLTSASRRLNYFIVCILKWKLCAHNAEQIVFIRVSKKLFTVGTRRWKWDPFSPPPPPSRPASSVKYAKIQKNSPWTKEARQIIDIQYIYYAR